MKTLEYKLTKDEYDKFSGMNLVEFYTELQANFLSPQIIYSSGFLGADKPYEKDGRYFMEVRVGA